MGDPHCGGRVSSSIKTIGDHDIQENCRPTIYVKNLKTQASQVNI